MNSLINSIINTSRLLNLDVYLVGGGVRDIIINRSITDLDFVINNDPRLFVEKLISTIGGSFTKLYHENKTFRINSPLGYVLDFSSMRGNSIEEDLSHRDFTINAMAYNLKHGWPIQINKIIDPFNGKQDIESKTIKHVYKNTFIDAPIRMLRAPRFMAQLEYNLDKATELLIKSNSAEIKNVTGEPITDELFKVLKESKSHYYLNYMDKNLILLNKIFPDLEEMKKIGECKYHVVDSWTHSIYTVKVIESVIYAKGYFEDHIRESYEIHTAEKLASNRSRLELIKLGALLHDVGKPSARIIDSNGRIRFKGHEIAGAEIVKQYADRLKLSTKEKNILSKYVYLHMLPLVTYTTNDVSGKVLYEMFNKMENETLDILLIALADIISTRKLLNPEEEMAIFKVHIQYIANNYLTRYNPLEDITSIITGHDIMDTLKLSEGSKIGELLEAVKKAIYLGQISPTKDNAINYIKGNIL
ncbi:HD domain-containing protein [Alkaliphilus pronyensis]|uniref:HD domain-containing protein n=1 Tax=Alkaliphilus pronyensis TaxID=1482732 RepID=A0A6I0FNB7_9FIRM|nr:HD domain-containing protein [Alkaliphilus pronyensis]KAB3537814.1 HD domain-containing protein [Alkaliphilus pronyensis]